MVSNSGWVLIAAWVVGLAGCAADASPLEAKGHVVGATFATPVKNDDSCFVKLRPDSKRGLNCHLSIECNGKDVYGGKTMSGGYLSCETKDKKFTKAVDPETKDGDPSIEYDVVGKRIKWKDVGANNAFEILIDE